MAKLLCCLLALASASASASAAAAAASDLLASESVAAALAQNDECAEPDDESGQCTLSAVQLRASKRAEQKAEEAVRRPDGRPASSTNSTISAAHACIHNVIGEMVATTAPQCVEKCPGICNATLPLLGVRGENSDEDKKEAQVIVCEHAAPLRCVLRPENFEVCKPLIEMLRADMTQVPETEVELDAICANPASLLASTTSVAGALRARASGGDAAAAKELLDRALTRKEDDARCLATAQTQWASEGQTCVANGDGSHTNSYVYCSNHKRLSAGATYCEYQRGFMSWCQMSGSGLTRGQCDDPFCRNGGAAHGDGKYCHLGSVVSCTGQNPPDTLNSCSDVTSDETFGDSECTITEHWECAGDFPNPYCAYTGTTRSCSESRRRRSFL